MQATLTNTSGAALNSAIVEDLTSVDGVSMGASGAAYTGGAIKSPLPFPFGHIGELANAASVVLPMHPADFRRQEPLTDGVEPRREWLGLIQKGAVTLAFAQETDGTDVEEAMLTVV